MNTRNHTDRTDIYSRVTNAIIDTLEAGTRPWMKPWTTGHAAGPISRPLRATGEPYKGINVLMLWASAAENAYACPLWLTYRQARERGGQVRKGEHGTQIVYASTFTKEVSDDATGDALEQNIPFLKAYTVFNAEQITGLPAHYYALAHTTPNPDARDTNAEAFVAATKAVIEHGGASAYYRMDGDRIQLPVFEAFRDRASYYATLTHELVHWTRHPSRLDRDLGRKRFADAGYAMEELVAEIGAAFLCADLGLTPDVREDHAAYVANWLRVLRDDTRAIFTAAAHAQRAVEHLHNYQQNMQSDQEVPVGRDTHTSMLFCDEASRSKTSDNE